MAGFRKAKAEQAALKLGLYGPPGSGKTFTALLLAEGLGKISGKRVAYIDTERGTDFYCQTVKTRAVHPDAFDFDAIYTRSITEVLSAVRGLNPADHGVLVLDSITHLWEAAMAAYGGRTTSIGTIPMHAWGKIKKPYKDLMSWMLSTPMHIIICGRQKTVYETDEETEELKSVGVTMRAEGETPYEPHILIRMEAIKPKKTNEIAQIVAYAEKDRTGVLSGRSFINPNFDTLCRPLLGLLGSVQAHMTTTDEAAGIDAEQLQREDTQRQEDSTRLLRQLSAKIDLCSNLAELKALGKAITPQIKAQMLTADVASLREKYGEAEERLPKESAPSAPVADAPAALPADASGTRGAADPKPTPMLDVAMKAVTRGDFDMAADIARSLSEKDRQFIEESIAQGKAA